LSVSYKRYATEDFRVMVIPPDDLVTTFLKLRENHHSPLCFNFEALRTPLEVASCKISLDLQDPFKLSTRL
jgi:hypothetical protein